MTFTQYLLNALRTAKWNPHQRPIEYCALGLVGEAGEIANKVKKISRDHDGILTDEMRDSLAGEIGDVLWYLTILSDELGLDINKIARQNIAKLASRLERGQLKGSGDNR